MDIFSQLPILVIVVPMMVAFLIPIVGYKHKGAAFPFVIVGLGASFLISFQIAFQVYLDGPIGYKLGGWEPPWGIAYYIDYLNSFMMVLIRAISRRTKRMRFVSVS